MEVQNSGIIPETPRPNDWIVGTNSPMTPSVVMVSSDWENFLGDSDRQSIPGVMETFNCTGFATARAINTWLNFFIYTGDLSETKTPLHWQFLKDGGYFDANGKVRVSPRFIGSMAGTSAENGGNRVTTVLDSVRANGVCADATWAWDKNVIRDPHAYYATPSQAAIDQANKFKSLFQINYEWFFNDPGNYKSSLQVCPLICALYTCNGWMTDNPVKWCNISGTNHCTELAKEDLQSDILIGDSYPEYIKHLSMDYSIPYAFRFFLTIKPEIMVKPLDGYKRGSQPADQTVYILLPNGVMCAVASWDAYVALGGATNLIQTVSPQDEVNYLWFKDEFLSKNN